MSQLDKEELPVEGLTNERSNMESPIATLRSELSEQIEKLQTIVDERPANGAELTLALRHLQDARMRLGVAMAMENGQNPWKS